MLNYKTKIIKTLEIWQQKDKDLKQKLFREMMKKKEFSTETKNLIIKNKKEKESIK